MPATFEFQEDTGVATGTPSKGTTRTAAVTDVNWKNSGVQGDAYSAFPITAGNNSFEKWQFGRFSGTFNQVLAGLWAHTATAFGTGLTLKGAPTGASQLTYTTPSATANANLSEDMTAVTAIASGTVVYFGATGPEVAAKTASGTANPLFTNYLTTQLQTTASANAGDTATITISLQYQEN